MENIVFDVADLNTGVLCCWSVLEQGLEPGWNRRSPGHIIGTRQKTDKITNEQHNSSLPLWSCKQQNFMCIKWFPLHQESNIRHLLVVKEVGVWKEDEDDNKL